MIKGVRVLLEPSWVAGVHRRIGDRDPYPARRLSRHLTSRCARRRPPLGRLGEADSAGRPAPVATKAAAIDAAQARPLTWKTTVKRALVVAVAGAAIYVVLAQARCGPGSWPRLSTLSPVWFSVAGRRGIGLIHLQLRLAAAGAAHQRLVRRGRRWARRNAVTDSLPGGDAAGAAVQFGMLTTAGFDTATAVGGLTAFSLLGIGGLLALPILALPAILAGGPAARAGPHRPARHRRVRPVRHFRRDPTYTDRPLAIIGRAAQGLRNWVARGRRPSITGLDIRLLTERDTIKTVLRGEMVAGGLC